MMFRSFALALSIAIVPAAGRAVQTAMLYLPDARTGGATILELHDVRVPRSGATVTVYGHSLGNEPQRLSTLYIVGSSQLSGERTQTLRAVVNAPPTTIRALTARNVSVTVVACAPSGSCITTGPFSLTVFKPQ